MYLFVCMHYQIINIITIHVWLNDNKFLMNNCIMV